MKKTRCIEAFCHDISKLVLEINEAHNELLADDPFTNKMVMNFNVFGAGMKDQVSG